MKASLLSQVKYCTFLELGLPLLGGLCISNFALYLLPEGELRSTVAHPLPPWTSFLFHSQVNLTETLTECYDYGDMALYAPYILVINGGSSSVKFAVFHRETYSRALYGKIDRIGMSGTYIEIHDTLHDIDIQEPVPHQTTESLLERLFAEHIPKESICVVGHRVVYGGTTYQKPVLITPHVLTELTRLSTLLPQHLPRELLLIKSCQTLLPSIDHVACFDTSFFKDLPPLAQRLPLPRKHVVYDVKRHGFHGLSYASLMHELTESLHEPISSQKIILAHLGSGSSLAAVQNGKVVETTMGFSPTSGLPMGSRSGDLDPGLFTYYTETLGYTPAQFVQMVNYESGLRGISETTADMEVLLARAGEDPRAEEAVSFFCYHVRKHIGALATVMNGVDMIVFTGGMGEKSAPIRKRICTGLEFLGVHIHDATNLANNLCISESSSRVILYVLPASEEMTIVRYVVAHMSTEGRTKK